MGTAINNIPSWITGPDLAHVNVPPKQHGRDSISHLPELQQHQAMYGQQPRGPPPPSGLGNPGPLGLGSFAMTTFILSCFNAGVLIDSSLEPVVLPVALFYGGIAQFIAGLYEFKIPNTFGFTAFCSYGAFWVSFAAYVQFVVPTLPAAKANEATGLLLLAWAIFTAYMLLASVKVSWVVFGVFFALEVTFILLAAGNFANNKNTVEAGGWFGLITAFLAWYGSGAVVVNSTWGREVFPLGVHVPENPDSLEVAPAQRTSVTLN